MQVHEAMTCVDPVHVLQVVARIAHRDRVFRHEWVVTRTGGHGDGRGQRSSTRRALYMQVVSYTC
jgi:hypothetical protein